MREPTPLLLVFESEMIGNYQLMSWSETVVNTGYLAEKHTIWGCGYLRSAGSQLQDHCGLVTQSEMMENVQYVNFTVIPTIVFTVLKYKVYLQTQYFNAIQHGILCLYFKSSICVKLVTPLLQTFRLMISVFNVILWSLRMLLVQYIYIYANKWTFLC